MTKKREAFAVKARSPDSSTNAWMAMVFSLATAPEPV
jgi:hypothetical protein